MCKGGTDNVFTEAVRWRDTEEKRVGKPRTDRLFATGRARSPLGVPGVYQSKTSYVVAWSPAPRKIRREFISITRYGKKEALRRAIELRPPREREDSGRAGITPTTEPPTPPQLYLAPALPPSPPPPNCPPP